MIYKKKIIFLSALVLILAVVFILSLVFDPENQGYRAFAFLDANFLDLADGIEIYGPSGGIVLRRVNNIWVFKAGAVEYPVKQARVEDLLAALSLRGIYPVRARSLEAGERLGLSEGRAGRIRVTGGAGLPLLDLLVGTGDASGREVYLRRSGEREIYSGEDSFTIFTDSAPAFWYDLRLFDPIDTAMVQQAEVSLPESGPEEWVGIGFVPGPPGQFVLLRSGGGWILRGNESAALDNPKVEAWLRSILEAEGADFGAETPAVIDGHITLYLGDGTSRAIRTGPALEQKRRAAAVSGTDLVYVLSEWTLDRLFRESSYFLKTVR